MQLTFRGSSFTQLGAAGTSITVPLNGRWILNDILIAFFGVTPQAATGGVTTIPAGWTQVSLDGSVAGVTMDSFFFVPVAVPAASYTWVFATSAVWFGGIAIYGPAAAPTIVSALTASAGACTACAMSALTGSGAGFGVGDTLVWDCYAGSRGTCDTSENWAADFTLGAAVGGIRVGRFPHVAGVADPTFPFHFCDSTGNSPGSATRDAFLPLGTAPAGGGPVACFPPGQGCTSHWARRTTRANPTNDTLDFGPRTGRRFQRRASGLWAPSFGHAIERD